MLPSPQSILEHFHYPEKRILYPLLISLFLSHQFIDFWGVYTFWMDFPGGPDGKESACNAGDLGLIPLGWEDPLGEDLATHSSIFAWRIPMDRGAWRAAVHGVAKELSD